MNWVVEAVAAAAAAVLVLLSARRVLLVVAALLPKREIQTLDALPPLTLVVPARDEARSLPRLFAALDRLDYPDERLFIILVEDGSVDATGPQLARWAAKRPRNRIVLHAHAGGKAVALNTALAGAPPSEIVAVCDADLRPEPDCLRELGASFADRTVGAVAGYMRPANADATPVARYAAIETWMTQLVTGAGKDRLGLDPPMFGLCAYRRSALQEIGGFAPGAVGEDLLATVALVRSGWGTRFNPRAVAQNFVVDRLGDYWRQHVRWTGNTFDAGRAAGVGGGSVAKRIEMWVTGAGYTDRLALVFAILFAAVGSLPLWLPLAYLVLRGLEVVVALAKGGVGWRAPLFFVWAPAFFAVDVAASIAATAQYARRRRHGSWISPRRREQLQTETAQLSGQADGDDLV